jgi:hypothetical protein
MTRGKRSQCTVASRACGGVVLTAFP